MTRPGFGSKRVDVAVGVVVLCVLLVTGLNLGCGSRPTNNAPVPLKGEVETQALLKAMEDAVAVKDHDADRLADALRQVVAADAEVERLQLTVAEREALDARHGAKKADLLKRLEQ